MGLQIPPDNQGVFFSQCLIQWIIRIFFDLFRAYNSVVAHLNKNTAHFILIIELLIDSNVSLRIPASCSLLFSRLALRVKTGIYEKSGKKTTTRENVLVY